MPKTGADIVGGCFCGAVRFRSTAPPFGARQCWCRFCQHIGAGGPTVNAFFARDTFTIEGEMADFERTADSGARIHSRFCPKCGCQLFSEAEPRPHVIVVRMGALDDPNIVAPTAVIWTSTAPQWACHDPDLPQFPAQPPPA